MKMIWEWFVEQWKRDIFFRRMIVGFAIIAFTWFTAMALGLTKEREEFNPQVEQEDFIENDENVRIPDVSDYTYKIEFNQIDTLL